MIILSCRHIVVYLALSAGAVLADPRLVERPPLGHFEHDYHASFREADEHRRRKAQAGNDKLARPSIRR